MRSFRNTLRTLAGASLWLAPGCGGGDSTPPIAVASVAITSPAAPLQLGSLTQAVQFTAVAKDGSGAAIPNATITWSSSNAAVASVSATGVVTSVANGASQITALSGGQTSTGVAVTVQQVPHHLSVVPAQIQFGAIGAMRQIAAQVEDSLNQPVPGATVTFAAPPSGKTSVDAGGLVTALANSNPGQADSIIVTANPGGPSFLRVVLVTIAQVPATIAVTSIASSPDTLKNTGSTRQFQAAAVDSNAHPVAATFTWSSSGGGFASVDGSGLVTAVSDGAATISAKAGTATGIRAIVVRRFAQTFALSPTSASITAAGATQGFNGTARDSSGANLTITWTSRNGGVATVLPLVGTSTTASPVNDGTTFIVMSAGTRTDSANLTISGQPSVHFAADIQPIFTSKCAKSGCHSGTVPTGGMNLTAGQAYNNIVNVMANQAPALMRVLPGSPNDSYIVIKVEGPGDPRFQPNRMPDDAPITQPFLTSAQVQLIRNWILAGAPNN